MNKSRRNKLNEAIGQLQELSEALENIKSIVEQAKEEEEEEEEEYRDNMPENLQGSEKYEMADAACDALDSAVDKIGEFELDEIVSLLEEAQG